jgi:zinc/manganese transport system permease protein
VVVNSSVKISGVLAVFSFLIVPLVCATLLGLKGSTRLYWAWGIGLGVSLVGAVLSDTKDLLMGASIVCVFGLAVILIFVATRMKNTD